MDKVKPGQPWRPRKAADHNTISEAAEYFQRRVRLGEIGETGSRRAYNGNTEWVRNDSGAAVASFDVLALDGVVALADDYDDSGVNALEWSRNIIWKGAKPNTSTPSPTFKHIGRFGVLLEPAPTSGVAEAVISGVTVAQLSIGYADHPYADIAHDTVRLTSNWYGAAEILYSETVGSAKWGLVRIGEFQSPPYKGVVTQSGGIAAGSSGTVTLYFRGGVTSPAQTVTAYFDWMDGAAAAGQNKECLVRFFRDEQRWQIVELQC